MSAKASALVSAILLAIPPLAAAETEEAPICTDRPAKANAVCTVPVGKWQLETAPHWLVADRRRRRRDRDARDRCIGREDRPVRPVGPAGGIAPYCRDQDEGRVATRATHSGFGDVTDPLQASADRRRVPRSRSRAIPFVKLPTAERGIGNGKVEGGLAVPISMAIGGPFDADARARTRPARRLRTATGHHAATGQSRQCRRGRDATSSPWSAKLWTMTNFDPADTVTLASADAALAYAVNRSLQLDMGANFGLDRQTPDVELYFGVSFRF